MTRDRFDELRDACEKFCNVRYTGCRQSRDNANLMLYDIIKGEKERKKNSKYFVYFRNVNHGTTNYPDIEKALFCENLAEFKETEKSFVCNRKRIDKDKIVAWLS